MPATTLIFQVKVELNWSFSGVVGLGSPKDQSVVSKTNAFADGAGDDQAKELYTAQRTVAVGANDDLDLSGILADIYGNVINYSAVKCLCIFNLGTPSGDTFVETAGEKLLVGGIGAAGHAWGAPFNGNQDVKMPVEAGSMMLLTNKKSGLTVSPGAQDILRVANSGTGDITYQIVLAGVI